MTTNIKQSISY